MCGFPRIRLKHVSPPNIGGHGWILEDIWKTSGRHRNALRLGRRGPQLSQKQFAGEVENAVMVLHGSEAHSRYMGEGIG